MDEDLTEKKRRGGYILDSVPEGMHTRAQAAKLVGRSYDTLATWHRNGTYPATKQVVTGKSHIWLYDDEDIERMRDIAGSLKSGPRPREEENAEAVQDHDDGRGTD